jgi:hypothetical protein
VSNVPCGPQITRTSRLARSGTPQRSRIDGWKHAVLGGVICCVGIVLLARIGVAGLAFLLVGGLYAAWGLRRLVRFNRAAPLAPLPPRETWLGPQGLTIGDEDEDTTVPWSLIDTLRSEVRGATLRAWIVCHDGTEIPLPSLARTDLATEGDVTHATALVQACLDDLRAELARGPHAGWGRDGTALGRRVIS